MTANLCGYHTYIGTKTRRTQKAVNVPHSAVARATARHRRSCERIGGSVASGQRRVTVSLGSHVSSSSASASALSRSVAKKKRVAVAADSASPSATGM